MLRRIPGAEKPRFLRESVRGAEKNARIPVENGGVDD
jgi:hypothetical protein